MSVPGVSLFGPRLTPLPVQIAAAVISCLLAAGIVFGYAALKPVLKQEGAYRDVCPEGHDGDTCVEIHLNLMFTVAAVGTNVAALPVGAMLDRRGPRACSLVGAGFLAAGAAVLAAAPSSIVPGVDAFLVGYLLLALGGPFIFIPSFQLSNAFPRNSGLILALLTGAFDSSSAIFLVYRLVFDASAGAFGHRRFFLAYLAVPIFVAVTQLTVMPARSYKTVGELVDMVDEAVLHQGDDYDDQVDEETALLRQDRQEQQQRQYNSTNHYHYDSDAVVDEIESLLGSARGDEQLESEERKNVASGVWGVLHDRTVVEQVSSPWFILVCLFTVVQMTRINYFVATIYPQYEAMLGDAAAAARVNGFFDVALPAGGLVAIPLIGIVLDNVSTVTVLSVLVALAAAIGGLGLVPTEPAAYANVALFVLYRPFYYTAVSDYCAKVFGFRTFGTVYGLIICLSGLLNFSQSALDLLFHRTFRGDPAPVNIMLLVLGLGIGLALVTFVAVQLRRIRRAQ